MESKNFIFRIDDRLIHGQVTVGWIIPLNLKNIYVVDDISAKDEFLQELWSMSLPENTILKIFSFDNFKNNIEHLEFNDALLLVSSIEMAYKILHFKKIVNQINIGGLHFNEGKIGVFPWFFVSQTDIEYLKKIINMGINIYVQMVKSSKRIGVDEKFIKKMEKIW